MSAKSVAALLFVGVICIVCMLLIFVMQHGALPWNRVPIKADQVWIHHTENPFNDNHTTMTILEVQGKWVKYRYNNYSGYITSDTEFAVRSYWTLSTGSIVSVPTYTNQAVLETK